MDTIDTARDLEWFLQRYPLEFETDAVARRLKRGATKHRERAELVESILTRNCEPRDFDMAIPARDYQKAAAELALASGGLLIADDMGLGKTVQAIAMLTDARTRPALVVAPKSLQLQWQRQIKKFAPGLTTHILKSTTPYPLGNGKNVSDEQATLPMVQTYPDVIISTYAKLAGWASALGKVCRSCTFDECQELRSGESRQGNPIAKNKAAKHLATKVDYRLGLSGTPIYNMGSEMFNVMECLRPGALGELAEFNREWCQGWSEKVEDPKAFGAFLRQEGLMLRRTRADVGRELPPLSRIFHDIDSDPEEIDNIEEAATALAKLILQDGPEAVRGERMKSSGELSYLLRQATGQAKAPYVAEFVRMIVESGEPVALFGWHHSVYRVWQERLAAFNPVLVTGEQSGKQKDDALQAFVRGDSKVIIISLRAAAGLDGLQFATSTVVHGELDWSPGVMEQCDARVFRDGQAKPVIAYYLTSTDGSDPVVSEALREKGEQLEGIRDPDAEFFEKLQTNDAERVRSLAEAFLKRRARAKEVA
ncbi:MAG TPA: DEAD/DEAH box helicase [Polyangiaceae bacterium]|nr:DEAD/DEAH box helicase [Polyangiaceae bacterium]